MKPRDPKNQFDLPLFRKHRDQPDVHWLVNLVKQRGWTTRKEVLQEARLPHNDRNLRWVRALAEAAGPVLVRGQAGFNHVDNCKVTDILHSANQAISQGKLMIKYGINLRHIAHAKIG